MTGGISFCKIDGRVFEGFEGGRVLKIYNIVCAMFGVWGDGWNQTGI